jgi:ATP-dependent Lon protease
MFPLSLGATTQPLPTTQVIKESSSLALSWVKMHAYDLQITSDRSEDPLKAPSVIDIHLHLPAGAQKKVGWCDPD